MQAGDTKANVNAVVAGLFYDSASTQAALTDLRAAGFSPETIGHASEMGTSEMTTKKEKGGFLNSLSNFFGGSSQPSSSAQSMSTTSSTDVHSSLIGMGLDAEDARELESRLEDGGVLIIVQAGKKGMDALEILKRHGASPADMELNHGSTSTQETMTAESPQRLQLLKEVLKVNKERVQKGEVRLRKEVITETKTMDVPVTHEEVVIERRLVTDETTATGQIGDDQTIRVPLTEEQVKVDKRAVVTEEILVGKREVEETQKVSETVRREELRTDSQGNVIVQDSKRTKP